MSYIFSIAALGFAVRQIQRRHPFVQVPGHGARASWEPAALQAIPGRKQIRAAGVFPPQLNLVPAHERKAEDKGLARLLRQGCNKEKEVRAQRLAWCLANVFTVGAFTVGAFTVGGLLPEGIFETKPH